jgi:hypothetical protein
MVVFLSRIRAVAVICQTSLAVVVGCKLPGAVFFVAQSLPALQAKPHECRLHFPAFSIFRSEVSIILQSIFSFASIVYLNF